MKLTNFVFIKKLDKGEHSESIDLVKNKYDNLFYILKEIEQYNISEENFERKKEIINILRNDNHPNIMKYYGYFLENNSYYFVLEFINGVNLKDFSEQYKSNNQYLSQNLIIKILKRSHKWISLSI